MKHVECTQCIHEDLCIYNNDDWEYCDFLETGDAYNILRLLDKWVQHRPNVKNEELMLGYNCARTWVRWYLDGNEWVEPEVKGEQ